MPKSRREIPGTVKAGSVAEITDSTNPEKKSITSHDDYKKMSRKSLYELESESMPAT